MAGFGWSYPAGCDSVPDDEEKLDAYGHLNWTVGTDEEKQEDGEWMACFDAIYNRDTNTIDYEVVVDGGSFVDTPETGSIPAWDKDKVAGLKSLPEYWQDIGIEHGLIMDDECLKHTMESWGKWIDELLTQGMSKEDEDAARESAAEQSIDYFDHFVAGDR